LTYPNIGPRAGFVRRWLSAFLVGWPVTAMTACVASPLVRSAALRIVALIEGGSVRLCFALVFEANICRITVMLNRGACA
jgi:hypothetical protein